MKESLCHKNSECVIRERAVSERVVVPADSFFTYIFFIEDADGDSGAASPVELSFILSKPGAQLTVVGFDLKNHGATSVQSTVLHQAPRTTSRVMVKSVLSGDAKSDYKGIIHIEKQAQGANASFTHRSLLLSDQARSIAHPILEIDTNDVIAKHAATVGSLDENILFYLESRGLRPEDAHALAIEGFLAELLVYAPDPASRKQCEQILQQKLKNVL